MKRNGISLIVLVITIIVMVILAGTVIMSLSDTGLVGASNETIDKYNKIEVTQYANMVWIEEYMSGKRGAALRTAVLQRLASYESMYNIGVTNKGVTVKYKNESLESDEDLSGEELLGPDNGGLYNASGTLIASWETLINRYGLNAEKDYNSDNGESQPGMLKYIMENNSSLTSATHLVISNRITRVGDGALAGTTLKKITVPGNVKILGDMSLSGTALEEVVLSEGVEILGGALFALSINLTRLSIPSTVTAIGDLAFAATKITSLHIPAATTYIGKNMVWAVSTITSLTVSDSNPNYKAEGNILFSKDGTVLCEAIMPITGEYRIPDGVITIREGALCATQTSKIIVPASVVTIENSAFEENRMATIEFEAGSNLRTVGKSTFIYTNNLTELVLPEGVTSIGDKMFCGSNIRTVVLPSTITTIGEDIFLAAYDLTTFKINATTPPTIGTITTNDVPEDFKIVVPAGCGETYKSAAGWSTVANLIVESAG